MRILHFAPYLTNGGVAGVWINLTKAFSKLGHEVYLVGPNVNQLKDYVNSYKVTRAVPAFIRDPLNPLTYACANKSLVEDVLKTEHVDVLLTHGPLAALCLKRDIMSRVKCYSVVHGTYANELKWMKFHPVFGLEKTVYTIGIKLSYFYDMRLYKLLSRLGVKFIAVSSKTKEELLSAGIKKDSVHNILNGVDKQLFKTIERDEAERYLKEKFSVETNGFTIVHVGSSPRKGTHNLIKALALLKRRGVNFTALLVGRIGPSTYRRHLERMIAVLGLTDHIRIIGPVGSADLPYIYSTAHVTVVPSYSEGSPLVIPESLACSTPVIATDVGGNAEYLRRVNLGELLIEVKEYDISGILYWILNNVMEKYHLYKNLINLCQIPSWTDTAKEYIKIVKM